MRVLKLTLLSLFTCSMLSAQSGQEVWESIDEQSIQLSDNAEPALLPQAYEVFTLDQKAMTARLSLAPQKSNASRQQPLEITLPTGEGQMAIFEIYESSVMMPALAAKYPMIKSYQGQMKGNPDYKIRLDNNTLGFSARFETPDGLRFIIPYASHQDKYYISFLRKDVVLPPDFRLSCGADDDFDIEDPLHDVVIAEDLDEIVPPFYRTTTAEKVTLRTYRIAVAVVAEYTIQLGGVANAMSRIVAGINVLNGLYEAELAITFTLIDNNDLLIFTDPNTDPYTGDISLGRTVLGQNQSAVDGIIGSDNYDIGHVLTIQCTDGILGVAAFGSVCNANKATGVTCGYTSDIVGMVTETMAHEVGHQFSASHSWNYCASAQDQRAGSTAFEPGSGSTIMSYAGSCGVDNVQFRNDPYFHVGSLIQISTYARSGGGSVCGSDSELSNNKPVLTHGYENGFHIPINTPFLLTAEATDQDGDNLTFCWEQYNTFGEPLPLGQQFSTTPSFRSYSPKTSPTRYFPALTTIIAGNTFSSKVEVLPDYERNLTFRCTARDDVSGGAGVVWTEELSFESTETAGPFEVMIPNTGAETWKVGDLAEVTWDVANTDNATVNCQKVNILLSTNNGLGFTFTLAENVPNDGSHMVVVPDQPSSLARIMVVAADNIFFDISDAPFNIVPATEPGFFLTASPYYQQVCLPGEVSIGINTSPILGYDSLVTYSFDGLPAGAVATFSKNPARPSENISATIDMTNVSFDGLANITLLADAPNLGILGRNLELYLINADFSALQLTAPFEGESGVIEAPVFFWTDLVNVDFYDLEVATSPAFGASTVVSETNITGNNLLTPVILEKGTIYYWRVTPHNECGAGAPSAISTFQTEVFSCAKKGTGVENINIPKQVNTVVTSTINIPTGGTISDVNVSKLRLNFSPVFALEISLKSPSGKSTLLYDRNCGNTSSINIGFDNDAPNDINCPPTSGIYKPVGDLSIFNGDDPQGDWILTVTVKASGNNAGTFQEWELEICSSSSVTGPTLVNNKVLSVKTGDGQWITRPFLAATDPNQGDNELVYTIVELPDYGTIEKRGGQVLTVGDTFTQSMLNNYEVGYFHDGSASTADGFFFTISDGEGGFIGKTHFVVSIDEGNPPLTATTEPLDVAWSLSPNPAQEMVTLTFGEAAAQDYELMVLNIQGQKIGQRQVAKGQKQLSLQVADWPVGMYFLQLTDGKAVNTQKVIIQR